MDRIQKMIEFEVDDIQLAGNVALIPGRHVEGTMRVGTVFTKIWRADSRSLLEPTHAQQTTIRVERITLYGHQVEELQAGLTCQLTVSAESMAIFKQIKPPAVMTADD
jgi:hypothetical protein